MREAILQRGAIRSSRRRALSFLAVAAGALALAAMPQSADAIGVTKCYFPNPGTGACVWGNLSSGASGIANWDGNGTEGGAMPSNAGVNYSRRWRVRDDAGGTLAGWWTNVGGNAQISVSWSRRAWMNFQCNNMEASSISVFCRSDNVG
jgi:hypothetical protein